MVNQTEDQTNILSFPPTVTIVHTLVVVVVNSERTSPIGAASTQPTTSIYERDKRRCVPFISYRREGNVASSRPAATMYFASSLSLLLAASAQLVAAQYSGLNVTPITGTWSSGAQRVLTGQVRRALASDDRIGDSYRSKTVIYRALQTPPT